MTDQNKPTHRQALNRYFGLLWPMLALYIALLVGGIYYLKAHPDMAHWTKVVLAIAVAMPTCLMVGALYRYANEADEFLQLIQLRAMAFSGAMMACLGFVLGFLSLFGVGATMEPFWFGVLFFLFFGVGTWRQGALCTLTKAEFPQKMSAPLSGKKGDDQ